MKRVSIAITANLLVGIHLASASFVDVDTIHDNHQAILYVQEQGVVEGYDDGTFKPDLNINRAEFIKIIMEAVYPGETKSKNCFSDVEKKDWFAAYVCAAKEKGIVEGYKDGSFQPAANINFAEAAKIISVAYEFNTQKSEPWYQGYVVNLGSRQAIPTTITGFSKRITRGEMAEMIYRINAEVTNKSSTTYTEIKNGQVQYQSDVKASVPTSQIVAAGPLKDGIPAIDNPKFVTANQATKFVKDQTYGILVTASNQSKFYPINILTWHLIVNDTFNGTPIVVTYDPLSFSTIVFERIVNSTKYDFGTSGKLFQSNLVMYDRQTDSYWSQLLAKAIAGDLTDFQLKIYPSSIVQFNTIKSIPGLQVLSNETGYDRDYQADPYQEYQANDEILFPISNLDQRLPAKTKIYAVTVNGKQKAYVYNHLISSKTLLDNFNDLNLRIDVDQYNRIKVTDSLQNQYQGYIAYWFSWAANNPNSEFWQK